PLEFEVRQPVSVDPVAELIGNFPVMIFTIFAVVIVHALEKMRLKGVEKRIRDVEIPVVGKLVRVVLIHLPVIVRRVVIIMVIAIAERQIKPVRKFIVSI